MAVAHTGRQLILISLLFISTSTARGQTVTTTARTPEILQAITPPMAVQTITIASGDTIYNLSRRYGTTTTALMALNKLENPNIKIGQSLIVPMTLDNLTAPTVAGQPVNDNSTSQDIRQATAAASLLQKAGTFQSSPTVPPQLTNMAWGSTLQSLLNIPYRYGAASPEATDCSGLTSQVMNSIGIKLPRTSSQQAEFGTPVELDQLQAGDLVFFSIQRNGRVDHVGIAIDQETFANANSYIGKVVIESMQTTYWKSRLVSARRVITPLLGMR